MMAEIYGHVRKEEMLKVGQFVSNISLSSVPSFLERESCTLIVPERRILPVYF